MCTCCENLLSKLEVVVKLKKSRFGTTCIIRPFVRAVTGTDGPGSREGQSQEPDVDRRNLARLTSQLTARAMTIHQQIEAFCGCAERKFTKGGREGILVFFALWRDETITYVVASLPLRPIL